MAFEPTSAISEQDGNTVRLYAAPRWVRPDGALWRPIQSLITPLGSGYDVLGPRGVASFRPAKRPVGGLSAAVIEGQQFGDEIILANVETSIQYTVTPPPGAVETENGWSLGQWDGVEIGLFFDDWAERFGERFSRRGTLLSLDLSVEKEAVAEDPAATLSLDPSIAVASYALHVMYTGIWATVRDYATSSSSSGSVIAVQGTKAGPLYYINRSCLRFDTSAYNPLTAYLFINTANTGTDVYLARSLNGFATPLTTNTNYAEVKTSYGDAGSQVGAMVSAGGSWYKSADLVAANRWAATSTYDLCLAEYAYDVLNPGAPTGANSVTISTGANQPYLLLALPFVGHHAVGRGVGNGVHMGIG